MSTESAAGNAALVSPGEAAQLPPADVARLREAHDALVALASLPDKPEDTPVAAARALWFAAARQPLSPAAALEQPLPALDASAQERFEQLLASRLEGVPLAHLTERQRFMGLELLAGPQALIPRHETELLGEAAVALLQQAATQRAAPLAVDVCTGSGNLAVVLASRVPSAQVHAADLSAEAVALARRNVAWLGLETRLQVQEGDLLAPFDSADFIGQVDVLTCNPPYISSARLPTMAAEIASHEPALAFDGGPLGIRILQRLLREAPRYLRPGGWLAFEVGAGQGAGVLRRLASDAHFDSTRSVADEQGEVRAVLARRAS